MLQKICDDRHLKASIATYQKQEQHHNAEASSASAEIRLTQAQLDRGMQDLEHTPRTPRDMTAVQSLARDCILLKRKLNHAQKRHEVAVHKALQAKTILGRLSEQRRQLHAKPAAAPPDTIPPEALMAAHLAQSDMDDAFELLRQADARAAMTPADFQEVEDLLRGYAPTQDISTTGDDTLR